jgi:cytosine/uracil/thiamine/allantoin permease
MTPSDPQLHHNKKALTSMITGIIGWVLDLLVITFSIGALIKFETYGAGLLCLIPLACTPIILWIVAIITGHMGLSEINRSNEGGRGMSIAGLVMGYLGVGLTLLGVLSTIPIIVGGGIAALPFLLNRLTLP